MTNTLTLFVLFLSVFALHLQGQAPTNQQVLDYPFEGPGEPSPEIPEKDLSQFRNLENYNQDFILESKQLFIKEYPTAFNPTIVRWNGTLLLCFRTWHPETKSTDDIGMVWLDDNFELISKPTILDVPIFHTGIPSKKQDPRLIVIDNRLYMVLNNVIKGAVSPEVRRMFITEVHYDGKRFYTDPLEGFFCYDGEREQRWEKNWAPFEYNGELLWSYSQTPHRILRPVFGAGECEEVAISKCKPNWPWGTIRGGTQAYIDGDKYLSFFHSSINLATVHSKGVVMPHYVMGAYTFSSTPPFEITHISPEPIVGKGFYSGPAYKTWKPLRVVFPGGFVFDDDYIWLVFGKQDHETWITKLDKRKLLDSLVPVDTEK